MNAYDEAVRLLPAKTAAVLGKEYENAEEFRLRTGVMPTALIDGREIVIGKQSVTDGDIACVVEKATNASVHTAQPEIAKGFISCRGGIRIGVCGCGIVHSGRITGIRDISSLSIRIPHEIKGCGQDVLQTALIGKTDNILILSPPGGGKTTLLRESIRLLSLSGNRVAVADERGELAAVYRGKTQFELGDCCDVMTGIPKAEAAMMLLRAMNPQTIVVDEISSPEDIPAAQTAAGCGVRIIASAHAGSVQELEKRPVYKQLLEEGIFGLAIIIENDNGRRHYRCEVLP